MSGSGLFFGNGVSKAVYIACGSTLGIVLLACLSLMVFRKRSRHKTASRFSTHNGDSASDAKFAPEICLSVKSWKPKEAIAEIVNFLKSAGVRVCVVRKRSALDKFIEEAARNGDLEKVRVLTETQNAHRAIITPVNDAGEEIWKEAKIIASESSVDDLVDGFMVADTGRVASLN